MLPPEASERPRLQLELGIALMEAGRLPEADAAFREAIDRARESDDAIGASAARWSIPTSAPTWNGAGWTEGRQIAAAAADELETDGENADLARVLFIRGVFEFWSGHARAGERMLETAIEHARLADDQRLEVEAAGWLGATLWSGPTPPPRRSAAGKPLSRGRPGR